MMVTNAPNFLNFSQKNKGPNPVGFGPLFFYL